jgi:Mn2+/Fe2+ NRAMP family transporter
MSRHGAAGDRPSQPAAPARRSVLRVVGPGLVVAATGVGAGDLVAAAVTGARYGLAVAWAAVVGAGLKLALNEGLARWQLATGQTLLEGWVAHLGRWVQYVFLAYLVVWSFVVAGALISACGLAAHALSPALSVEAWGVAHSLVAAALVLAGGYRSLERLIGVFVGVMFVTLIGTALWVQPPGRTLVEIVTAASLPTGSGRYVLGVIGGVGGSVTLLSYGYWMRERGWEGAGCVRTVRADLAVAYTLTGIFGIAVIVLAAVSLHGGPAIEGSRGVLTMAGMLDDVVGPVGRWTFLVGFWGAVATSMLGVWQGVPYLFCDFVSLMRRLPAEEQRAALSTRSPWYRAYLLWLAVPPMLLLAFDRPVGLIVLYSVTSALFMPFLAATLLFMNSSRRLVGRRLRNGVSARLVLVLCLALFAYLGLRQVAELF